MARHFRTPILVAISIGLSVAVCLVEELWLTGCGYATLQLASLDAARMLKKLVVPIAVLVLFQLAVAFTDFAISDQPRLPGLIAKGFGALFAAIGSFILFQLATESAENFCASAYSAGVGGSESLIFLSFLWFILWFAVTVVCVVANAFVPEGKQDV